jgi:flavin-dependent dehydrogenase
MENGTTVIETPLREQRIASVYRGFGPKGSMDNGQSSFDNYLLDLCAQAGAVLAQERVTGLERTRKGICVTTNTGVEKTYDLVVGAVGLGKKSMELFDNILPAFTPPKTAKTHIAEFYMEKSLIDEYFGNSMHVFLLNIPHIKFGALIPKGSYVTLVLLGDKINRDIVSAFLTSKVVRDCFPPSTDMTSLMPCFCFPLINIRGAKSAYDDRVILIGDASTSKLYKNGIGSAYITGKAAASTVILHGISRQDFKKNYYPVCRELQSDNAIGKMVFALTGVIQKSCTLKKGLLNMVVGEQQKESKNRYMSAMLWDTFTGSAPYKDIIRRGLYPKTGISFFKNTMMAIFN